MEGAPCTWLWREMPLSAPGMRPGVTRTTHGLPSREEGACSSGEGETLPGGDRGAGLARGWGRGWPASRGVWKARGLCGRQGSRGAPADVGRGLPIRGGGRWLPIDYSWQGAGSCLGARAWRGSRDRETRGPRVEAGTVGPRAWSPCCGRRTSGSLQRLLAGAQAAGNSSRTNAADAGRLRSRGPSGRSAPGSGRSPEAASRRRAAVGLPRGPGPTSRSRGGGQGWAANGCTRGASRPRVTQPRPPPGAGTRPGPAVGS